MAAPDRLLLQTQGEALKRFCASSAGIPAAVGAARPFCELDKAVPGLPAGQRPAPRLQSEEALFRITFRMFPDRVSAMKTPRADLPQRLEEVELASRTSEPAPA